MDQRKRPRIAVIGAGPAGLMAAEVAAQGGAAVTVFDQMPSAGRKFLLAGRGGLNITHSEPVDRFLSRYGEAEAVLAPLIRRFPPAALRAWCADLGQPTIVGSSGRVFPAAFKTSPLLRAWLRRLDGLGVTLKPRHRWTGWTGAAPVFETPAGRHVPDVEAVILALGGASWPQLGSDGSWVPILGQEGVDVARLKPANCGFAVAWSDVFRERFAGQPLKGIGLRLGSVSVRGEALVSQSGIEGGAVYAIAAALREALARSGEVLLHVALRPDMSEAALVARLDGRRLKETLSTFLRRRLALAPVAIGLLREAEPMLTAPLGAMEAKALAALINAVPIRPHAPFSLARAISSAGGLSFAELDADLMLKARPGTFVAGEMLDWEAPTGGYLLQACMATGVAAGQSALGFARAVASQGAA